MGSGGTNSIQRDWSRPAKARAPDRTPTYEGVWVDRKSHCIVPKSGCSTDLGGCPSPSTSSNPIQAGAVSQQDQPLVTSDAPLPVLPDGRRLPQAFLA